MSIVGSIVSLAASPITDLIGKVIDKIFPDPEAANRAKLMLLEMEQNGELAQLEVNRQEAKHESIFVAGWRPFIGWVCGIALAYTFILTPLLLFIVNLIAIYGGGTPFDPALLPVLDIGALLTILLGMLGLGSMRTFEKWSGTNTNRVAK